MRIQNVPRHFTPEVLTSAVPGYFAADRHPRRGCKIGANGNRKLDRFERLEKQISFLLEIDKLKTILRRPYLLHADRSENTAEHSWHLALTAMILSSMPMSRSMWRMLSRWF